VKITVIATGFREVPRSQRKPEVYTSFASSHEEAMNFPQAVAPAPDPFFEPMPERRLEEVAVPQSFPVATPTAAEAISLETMRNAMVANFEQEDLDVPAFLRKRGDVM
jgi:hypothetical protein